MKHIILALCGLLSLNAIASSAPVNTQDMFAVSTSGATFSIRSLVPGQTYQTAGIKIDTLGYQLTGVGSECQNAGNGYCMFSVSDTKPATISFIGKAGDISITLCLDGKNANSCQQYNNLHLSLAYIANLAAYSYTGKISVCPIQTNGTFGTCQETTQGTFTDGVINIVLNAVQTLTYIINYPGESLSVCPINNIGELGACLQNVAFNFSYGGAALSPQGDILYVQNYNDDSIEKCPVKANGTLGTCVDSGLGGIFPHAYGIVINKPNTLAYVANSGTTGPVSVCSITNGSFTSCTAGTSLFPSATAIAFNGNQTKAYITNDTTVNVCTIGTGGTFSGCMDSGATFTQAWGIMVDAAHSKAYVADYGTNTVSVCPIKSDGTGTFGTCIDSTGLFEGPTGMALAY